NIETRMWCRTMLKALHNLPLLAFSFLQEKSSRLFAALLGEDCEISLEQLYELLQYAALGKRHSAAHVWGKPR
uniref:Uncharacterized protein n=1 Tax=Pavo cristatus TaxID=9049 RepID=A0A8C9FN01_PAVCR